MKVVINVCYGGFDLSDEAVERYLELRPDIDATYFNTWEVDRTDPALIQVVEELGDQASFEFGTNLKIVEIPDGVKWHIAEYDGAEWVAEDHRIWR